MFRLFKNRSNIVLYTRTFELLLAVAEELAFLSGKYQPASWKQIPIPGFVVKCNRNSWAKFAIVLLSNSEFKVRGAQVRRSVLEYSLVIYF